MKKSKFLDLLAEASSEAEVAVAGGNHGKTDAAVPKELRAPKTVDDRIGAMTALATLARRAGSDDAQLAPHLEAMGAIMSDARSTDVYYSVRITALLDMSELPGPAARQALKKRRVPAIGSFACVDWQRYTPHAMQVTTLPFRQRLKKVLRDAFGERFRRLILYGSEARGEATAESDIDVMVLLQGPVDVGADGKTAVYAISHIRLEIVDHPIHVVPVEEMTFERGEYALYRNAKREGVEL